ncbi:BolA domain-containing protein [Trichophyton interdigitale]|uniref:BolA protein n=2 Tax=Trichophyton TaxID=5550 RepID=A0A059JDB1_TRIIM|nr:hypothetical protein H101_05223 [Trichophyton interdigitale H6]KAG5205254.1 BolA domain-containing protein [Trichophyton interdigitale]KAG5217150.1 BolA domain-containing protein [Trichophyton interdigitale]KAG8205741.1 BolA domain-containing protein [Trichophyton interdigitale]KDB25845.1 hypothetical protein H109_02333 [Trichophyton interdigitale MR816]
MLRTIRLSQQRLQLFSRIPRMSASTATSQTPLEDAIREKVTRELSPISLTIRNDSKHHAHHAPMQGNTSTETHFHVTIISSAFASKTQPARHRMVYNLLKEEMAQEGGIHALQLKTRTPEEEEKAAKQ